MTTVCRGCGRPINWIRTHGGKKMPVETETVEFVADRGGPEIFVRRDGSVTVGRRAEDRDDNREQGYISHFAHCPKGDMFRKTDKTGKEVAKQQQMTMQL